MIRPTVDGAGCSIADAGITSRRVADNCCLRTHS